MGGGAKEKRVPSKARGSFDLSTDAPDLNPAPLMERQDADPPISHYKGTSLMNIGRYPNGKVIPHKRSEPTARKVAVWVSGGYNKNDVAVFLNIRPGLVEQCYGLELRHGAERVGMKMTEHIVARAKKSDVMAKFFAKSRMGWRDGETAAPLDVSPLSIHLHL